VNSLKILSGGAAHGLVASVTPQFTSQTGWTIDGTFGAVGVMAAKLRNGEAADVMVARRRLRKSNRQCRDGDCCADG
jgi:molybdate transport system substrate-binding protein